MTIAEQETILLPDQVNRLIVTLAQQVYNDMTRDSEGEWVIVGIRSGGALVARMLRAELAQLQGRTWPIGFLDITFYRDDLDTVGPNPVVEATDLSMDIDDKKIILVDDVLYTGRTIRAALNALFDFGRPESVDLVVLVDRGGHRQLPIQPHYTGLTVETSRWERIKLVEQKTAQEPGMVAVVRYRHSNPVTGT
ncbi:MAG: bifunctional pyr operon transcriptional regulator/uracil phosphoribosyltransferase PyrR [Magnetococcales bacterium]|nr:bifunctional pyr operon transcriptional regulator/uracil phosphoribosyltransferase PyrR [Magnetococcales bacterium]